MLGHFVLRKRFNPYRMCLWRRFVWEKRFRWYGKQFLRERFSRVWGGCIKTSLCPLMRPEGGGASGGSLRSSRQAGACHPFTRSWATMPPETPPPLGFSEDLIFVVPLCIYICSLKQQYREICVKMQQSLCELHLCKDG